MSVPLVRCRVLYIGSAVPTVTKDGLQGIQQPLRERYPADGAETKGIDSWLSVWSNGLLLEYIDGNNRTEGAFHPITGLHYCAAVRFVNGGGERFIPLDSAFGRMPESPHPPIFAAIFRRTTGVKVLECHAFICTNDKAANALVRCCFHAYADTICLKMEDKLPQTKAIKDSGSVTDSPDSPSSEQQTSEQLTTDDNRDEIDWEERAIGQKTWQRRQQSGEYDVASMTDSSVYKKTPKRTKKRDTQSEIYASEGILVPYGSQRRSGSHADVQYDTRYFKPGHPPPPPPPHHPMHFARGPMPPFGRPPPGFMHGPPPPHHFGKHPPPFFPYPYAAFPPPPPSARYRAASLPPMFARFGYFPPPPPPPHFMPPFMHPPPFAHMPQRARSPSEGPIITGPESIYDTYTTRRGNYEEPVYIPSGGTLPPNSAYKPGSFSTDHYEGYETYKRQKHPQQSDSEDTSVDDSHFWDAYETGAYRKANLAERTAKAGGHPEKSPALSKSHGTNGKTNGVRPFSQQQSSQQRAASTPKSERQPRPETPPADYELEREQQANEQRNAANVQSTSRPAAVF
ncbi:PID domain-containing protein [Aphelenchoides fujianensis]|nr:PID domain-containing protein [Aphelenchoides fujianensis]